MEQNEGGRALDLEKELSCSICTEVLYRPLTLLDCLHTFCGSCLKEWFTWQQASPTGKGYSCPACRAVVRDTRPNATLTTLLDMFLAAHPERGKTAQDKLDMDKTYKPGDNVIPLIEPAPESEQDDEDERMLAQARALSLNEVGLPSTSTSTSVRDHERRSQQTSRSNHSPHTRQSDLLSHQSSLRSLLSASDVDATDMEDEIMRHIIEQGLLDGVDLNNLTPAQEDQITDSIARAFRSRRHHDRAARRNRQRHRSPRPQPQASSSTTYHHHSLSSRVTHHQPSSSNRRSPSSHHQSPSSSSTRRRSPSASNHQRSASGQVQASAALSTATHRTSSRRRAASANHTQRLYPEAGQTHLQIPQSSLRPSNHSSPALPISSQQPSQPSQPRSPAPSVSCSRCQKPDIQYRLHYNCLKCFNGDFNLCVGCYRAAKGCLNWYGFGHAALARYHQDPDHHDRDPPHILSARRHRQDSDQLDQGLFCEACYSHADACYWHCDSCNEGAWGFCDACVQQGKHCNHPLSSVARISLAPSSATIQQSPQSLSSRDRDFYPHPLHSSTKSAFHFAVPTELPPLLPHVPDPSQYVLISLASYCDICHNSIPPTHARFHCNTCNEGNYDICTSCYHSLVSTTKISPENGPSGWRRCLQGHRMSVIGHEDREGGSKRIIVKEMVGGLALKEDATSSSTQSAATNQWRWRENDGTSTSQPSKRNMHPSRMPPDGGVGYRVQALWSYFPGEGVRDELSFPRNAIVNEVEDINGDWYWGVYAGSKGLFPGNYVRII